MKKVLVILLAFAFALTLHAERRNNLIKISTGATFNDVHKGVKQELDEDDDGNLMVKVTWEPKAGSIGMFNPPVKDWSKAEALVLEITNPSDQIISIQMVVVPADLGGRDRYSARSDTDMGLRPGKNTIRLEIGDFTSNDGTPLKTNKINHFYFVPNPPAYEAMGGNAVTLSFNNVYLSFPE